MAFNLKDFENKLWDTADALRANTGLKYNEFSTPVLGLIFLIIQFFIPLVNLQLPFFFMYDRII